MVPSYDKIWNNLTSKKARTTLCECIWQTQRQRQRQRQRWTEPIQPFQKSVCVPVCPSVIDGYGALEYLVRCQHSRHSFACGLIFSSRRLKLRQGNELLSDEAQQKKKHAYRYRQGHRHKDTQTHNVCLFDVFLKPSHAGTLTQAPGSAD